MWFVNNATFDHRRSLTDFSSSYAFSLEHFLSNAFRNPLFLSCVKAPLMPILPNAVVTCNANAVWASMAILKMRQPKDVHTAFALQETTASCRVSKSRARRVLTKKLECVPWNFFVPINCAPPMRIKWNIKNLKKHCPVRQRCCLLPEHEEDEIVKEMEKSKRVIIWCFHDNVQPVLPLAERSWWSRPEKVWWFKPSHCLFFFFFAKFLPNFWPSHIFVWWARHALSAALLAVIQQVLLGYLFLKVIISI